MLEGYVIVSTLILGTLFSVWKRNGALNLSVKIALFWTTIYGIVVLITEVS